MYIYYQSFHLVQWLSIDIELIEVFLIKAKYLCVLSHISIFKSATKHFVFLEDIFH